MQPKTYKSLDEVPDDIRKRLDSLRIQTKVWSGLLMFCCPYPFCMTDSENVQFLLRHAVEHGIYPEVETEQPTTAEPLEIRDSISFEAGNGNTNTNSER